MINIEKTDILKADVEAVVNTVNCVGIMGRGIALQFKKSYPNNFKAYEKACQLGEVKVGKMFVFETGQLTNPHFIINFPTKQHWKGKSKIEYIESGLDDLVRVIKHYNIQSIAIPPLGCGLGGLDWNVVKPLIEKRLADVSSVEVHLYEPGNTPAAAEMAKEIVKPPLNPSRASLLGLINSYLSGLMDPFITVLEVQKLMYFMQSAGQNELRLAYTKGRYGPYAHNLSFVLAKLEGHYIHGYKDGGDDPEKLLELVGNAGSEAHELLASSPDVMSRFDRVADLVEGFESPAGMELLATVHWVVNHEGALSLDEAIQKTHEWNARKKRIFEPRQIEIAYNVLHAKGWMN